MNWLLVGSKITEEIVMFARKVFNPVATVKEAVAGVRVVGVTLTERLVPRSEEYIPTTNTICLAAVVMAALGYCDSVIFCVTV